MSRKHQDEAAPAGSVDRRQFIGGAAIGLGAALTAGGAVAQAPPPGGARPPQSSDIAERYATAGPRIPQLFRVEQDIAHCEVEGKIPADLVGGFYRTGPDAQFPLRAGNIPFDGEGHVSMFRFENGRVDYKTRFVRNERYVAQEKAGKILFPMYRNPVHGRPVREGQEPRHAQHAHHPSQRPAAGAEGRQPARGDGPQHARDAGSGLHVQRPAARARPFTAHPKTDSRTGNLLAFGYEAEGPQHDGRERVRVHAARQKVWDAWVNVPYVGMLHDYQVTENYVMLYVIPLAYDQEQIERGGIHWSWYPGQPRTSAIFRRGGDGKDVKWIKGPERSATHMMGGFDDGKQALRRRRDVAVESVPVHADARRLAAGTRCAAPATSRGCPRTCRRRHRRTTASRRCIPTTSARCRGRTTATTPCRTATASCPARIRPRRIRTSVRPPATRASTCRTAPRCCTAPARACSWPRPASRRRAPTRRKASAT